MTSMEFFSLFFWPQYEYEAELETSYRTSLVKSFKKQIDDGYFSFIMVDCINSKTSHYQEMWSYAKQKGFEVLTYYISFFLVLFKLSPQSFSLYVFL